MNRYACTDGHVYAGVLLDSHWQRLADIMERPDLKTEENRTTTRFQTYWFEEENADL